MSMASPLTFLPFFFLLLPFAPKTLGYDPSPLQDICVADLNASAGPEALFVNGKFCKDPKNVKSDDFSISLQANLGSTDNTIGSLVTAANTMGSVITPANVLNVPGLNTLGVSMSRIDYAPGGINPPHTHPRATEIVFVLEGTLEVGFITTDNKLVSKTITKDDVFVFPRGLVHFQKNSGGTPAAALAAFNSQLPGTQSIAATLFASTPPVADDVLGKAFQIGAGDVQKIKKRLAPNY